MLWMFGPGAMEILRFATGTPELYGIMCLISPVFGQYCRIILSIAAAYFMFVVIAVLFSVAGVHTQYFFPHWVEPNNPNGFYVDVSSWENDREYQPTGGLVKLHMVNNSDETIYREEITFHIFECKDQPDIVGNYKLPKNNTCHEDDDHQSADIFVKIPPHSEVYYDVNLYNMMKQHTVSGFPYMFISSYTTYISTGYYGPFHWIPTPPDND